PSREAHGRVARSGARPRPLRDLPGGEAGAVSARTGSPAAVQKVVFACVHNAGRSQMAAAFFNRLADPTRAIAVSAGTQPAERVHPEVVAAMAEVGADLSAARPRPLTKELAEDASVLVTMGCGDQCPYVPGLVVRDWPLEDPKGQSVEQVRAIRDQIRGRAQGWGDAEGWAACASARVS